MGKRHLAQTIMDQLSLKGVAQTQWFADSFRQSGRQVHALMAAWRAKRTVSGHF